MDLIEEISNSILYLAKYYKPILFSLWYDLQTQSAIYTTSTDKQTENIWHRNTQTGSSVEIPLELKIKWVSEGQVRSRINVELDPNLKVDSKISKLCTFCRV